MLIAAFYPIERDTLDKMIKPDFVDTQTWYGKVWIALNYVCACLSLLPFPPGELSDYNKP